MSRPTFTVIAAALAVGLMSIPVEMAESQRPADFPIQSLTRPQPPVVTPGAFAPAPPPSDAVVLFDGKSLSSWRSTDSSAGPARWKVTGGYMEVVAGTGDIATARGFGDVQLHIEWATPTPPHGESQERGNSGVFLMGRYEVQVL